MYLNRIELIGFLGSDAEAKHTPNGKAVTTLSLATKTSFLKDGARSERTEWHRIQAWESWASMPRHSRRARTSAWWASSAAANTKPMVPKSALTRSSPTRSSICGPANVVLPRLTLEQISIRSLRPRRALNRN